MKKNDEKGEERRGDMKDLVQQLQSRDILCESRDLLCTQYSGWR
jgi:hypothetical protein